MLAASVLFGSGLCLASCGSNSSQSNGKQGDEKASNHPELEAPFKAFESTRDSGASEITSDVEYDDGGSARPSGRSAAESIPSTMVGNKRQTSDTKSTEVDIKKFGAKGNGEGDDSEAVISAIKYITSQGISNPTLVFPKGKFPLNVKAVVNNLRITGSGVIIPVKGKGDFTLILSGDNNKIEGLHFYEETPVKNLLTIDGNNNLVERCSFGGPRRSNVSSVVYSDRMLYFSSNEGKGNVVKDCKISNGRIGIGLSGSYKLLDSEISNCITGVWARPSTRNSEIARNIIHDNNVNNSSGADGILAQRNVSGLHIHHNKIYNSGEHGIYFQGDNSIIEHNEIYGNHGSGIKLASYTTQLYNIKNASDYVGHDNIIRNNLCYNNSISANSSTGAGIYLQAPLKNIVVSDNTCRGNYYGIRSTSVSRLKPEELEKKAILRNITFSSNIVLDNKKESMYIEGETGIVIEGNRVDDIMTTAKSSKHRMVSPIIRKNEVKNALFINRTENSVIEENSINKLNFNPNSINAKHRLSGNKIKVSNKKN